MPVPDPFLDDVVTVAFRQPDGQGFLQMELDFSRAEAASNQVTLEFHGGFDDGSLCLDARVSDWVYFDAISTFLAKLEDLHRTLRGQTKFQTYSGFVELAIQMSETGGVHMVCALSNRLGANARFEISFDQSYLPEIVRGLNKMARGLEALRRAAR
jgi:hypothetical protein